MVEFLGLKTITIGFVGQLDTSPTQGWGKVGARLGQGLGQGWGKVWTKSKVRARSGQARSEQGLGKVGARDSDNGID